MIFTTKKAGDKAEKKALEYLQKSGLRLVMANYRSPFGEIDLIMKDGPALVFIEVRHRTSMAYGGALASVTYSKQQKIIKTATHYLLVKKIKEQLPLRFDVLAINGKNETIDWVKNAFGLNF